jgi:hypothetical protein
MFTIIDMGMAEVRCATCKRPFIASRIEAAIAALRAHEEEEGHGQVRKVSAEIFWTSSDLQMLKGLKISPE